MTTPYWLQDAVFYQIFPDRFANGNPANDPANVQKWGAKPTNWHFQGGDLRGIIQRFDYLLELGINAIYLNKINELPESERAAFIDQKRREYEEDIDVYEVASDFSIEAVVPSDELRDELIRRYEIYCRKDVLPHNRRNGVMPV